MARGSLLGSHPVLRRALALAEGVAGSQAPLLLFGEAGTGRESLARHIHAVHPGSACELVKFDCAAAVAAREVAPLFRLTERCRTEEAIGTLLLREVGDLPSDAQECVAQLINGPAGRHTWRVIATSSRDLAVEVAHGTMRADLHAALSRITLYLAPLRQRRSDIPELVRHFLGIPSDAADRSACRISDEAMVTLWRYDWPGNVAELEQVVKSLTAIATRGVIRASDLPAYILGDVQGPRQGGPKAVARFQAAS